MEATKLPSRKFKLEMLVLIPLLLRTILERLIALPRLDAKVTNALHMIQLKIKLCRSNYSKNVLNLFVTDAKDVFALLKGREKTLGKGEEPTFTWFKSGQEFDPEDRFKVLFKDEEDTLALVFQHINPEDVGLYTCVASTSTGKISCSAELSVEGGVTQLLKVLKSRATGIFTKNKFK